jgi:hypothetical protein
MGVVSFRIRNPLTKIATLYPRRMDNGTTYAATEDAAMLTEMTSERDLSSDATFNLLRSTFS